MSALIGSRTLPVKKNKMMSVVIEQSGDLHVRLTGERAISDRVPARTGRVDQFRREPLHPPKQRHVIHLDAALLDEAPDPVGQGVPQVSAHRQQDHIRRKSEPGERGYSDAQHSTSISPRELVSRARWTWSLARYSLPA